MKWFKHQTSMRHDPKIRRVIRQYGADGYAIYNYILESIAGNLNPKDPLPNLEETSEDIAYDLKLDTLRVQEIVGLCLEQGLFSQDETTGHILCLKMYKFLDDATRKSASVVNMLNSFAKLKDSDLVGQIPSKSEKVRPDIDVELDKDLKKEKTFSPELCKFVGDFIDYVIKEKGNKAPKKTKRLTNTSLDTVDKLIRLDGFSLEYIRSVARWAVVDNFYSTSFFSLASLRNKSKTNDVSKFVNMASRYDKEVGTVKNGPPPTTEEICKSYGL